MVKLNTWAGLEPAVMEIKTVSGLAQVFELTLTDSAGSVVDLEGVTFRGAVNTAPLQEFVCSIKDGKVLFGWIGLPAGRHSFDLFMVTGAVEKALIHGAFVVVGRVLPPLDKESYSVNNAATVVFPDTVDGTLLIELSEVGLVDLLSRRAGAFTEEAKGCLGVIRELKEWIGGKVDGFGDVVETASTAIMEAGTAAVSAVEASHTEAVKAVSAEKEGALTLVNGAGETATTAITEARKEAVKAVSAEKEGALTAVNGAGEMATTAITEAGTEAVKTVSAKKDAAVTAIQTKQADSVLAVGRAQKTATDKVASVQGAAVAAVETAHMEAVTAVQTARTEAVGTITPLVERAETAKESIEQAEGRIKTVATNADQSAQTASNAATAAQQALAAIPQVDAAGNMTLAGGITAAGAVNANGGINAVAMLAPGLPKTGLNAGAAAVMAALGNVYHLDHVNGTITTLEGSNVKMEYILQGWCGVSWVGTSTMHKCLLIKAGQSNSNYCGAWSPMGTSDYALVMSYLSGVNMVDTSTKFGWTGYSGTVAATTIEDIPGPAFYTDCVNKKVVAKNAAGETTELPWTGISLDQVSRLDFIVVPSALTSCKIYLSIHPSVRTAHGNHYNFNRRYLTPQSYYIGEVPVGLTGNDCHYAVLDNNSEQMALFRVSVIQGINPADYLNIENI